MATTIHKDGGASMDDPASIHRFKLIALRSALKLEKVGMRSRHVKARKLAKQLTGLKTNDFDKLIEGVEKLIADQTTKVVFVYDPGTPEHDQLLKDIEEGKAQVVDLTPNGDKP